MYFVRENTLPSPFLFRWKRGLPSQLFSQINMCLIIFFFHETTIPSSIFPGLIPIHFSSSLTLAFASLCQKYSICLLELWPGQENLLWSISWFIPISENMKKRESQIIFFFLSFLDKSQLDKIFRRTKFSSDKIFVGQNISSDKSDEIFHRWRKFCPT